MSLFPGIDDLQGLPLSSALPDAVVDRRVPAALDLMYGRGMQAALDQASAERARSRSWLGAVDRGMDTGARFVGKTLGDVGHLMGGAYGALEGLSHAPGSYDPLGEVTRGAQRGYDDMRWLGSTVREALPVLGVPERTAGHVGFLADMGVNPLGPMEAAAMKAAALSKAGMGLGWLFVNGTRQIAPEAAAAVRAVHGAGETDALMSPEILVSLEKIQRQNFSPVPPTSRTASVGEMGEEYARLLEKDIASGSGLIPGVPTFYEDAAEAAAQLYPSIGRNISGTPGYDLAGEALQNPNLSPLFNAGSVPLSAQTQPWEERMMWNMALPEFLQRMRGGMTAREALLDLSHGAVAWKPGSFNPLTGRGTRLTSVGESVHGDFEVIARLLDELPGDPMEKMVRFSERLRSPMHIDEIARLRNIERPVGGWTDAALSQMIIPSALDPRTGTVPGWFLLGPKKGPYAWASTEGFSPWAVNDQHGMRAKLARLGGVVTKGGRPVSDAELEMLIEMMKAARRQRGGAANMKQVLKDAGMVIVDAPRGAFDREVIQYGQSKVAEALGMPASGVQQRDWSMIKAVLDGLGSETPMEGTLKTAMEATDRVSRETGRTHVISVADGKAIPGTPRLKFLSKQEIDDLERKGVLRGHYLANARRELAASELARSSAREARVQAKRAAKAAKKGE